MNGGLTVFLRHGYLSVDLFFLLSGYVVTTSNKDIVQSGYKDLKQFAIFIFKRFARLYPLYLCIVAYALYRAVPITPSPVLIQLALTNLTLIQSWGLAPGIGGPTWSLSLEWAAYFLFPLMAFVFLKPRGWIVALTIGVSATLLLLCAYWPKPFEYRSISGPLDLVQCYSPFPILSCLASFGLGITIYNLSETRFVQKVFSLPFIDIILLFTVIASLFIDGGDVIFVLSCFLFVISLVVKRTGLSSKLLSVWPIWWLGVISYSIYLLHGFAVNNFLKVTIYFAHFYGEWSYVHTILLLSLSVIMISSLTYLIIEKPARDYLLNLLPRKA